MKSATPKVLHRARRAHPRSVTCWRPSPSLEPEHLVVVVGHGREQVARPPRARSHPDALTVVQDEQNGTGHAVRVASTGWPRRRDPRRDRPGPRGRRRRAAAAPRDTLRRWSTARGGVGRVDRAHRRRRRPHRLRPRPARRGDRPRRRHRRAEGRRRARSAPSARSTPASTPSTPAALRDALGRLTTDNAQGEEYLTDVLGLLVAAGLPVAAVRGRRRRRDPRRQRPGAAGRTARALLRDRVNARWMRAGVTDRRPGDHLDRRRRRPSSATA